MPIADTVSSLLRSPQIAFMTFFCMSFPRIPLLLHQEPNPQLFIRLPSLGVLKPFGLMYRNPELPTSNPGLEANDWWYRNIFWLDLIGLLLCFSNSPKWLCWFNTHINTCAMPSLLDSEFMRAGDECFLSFFHPCRLSNWHNAWHILGTF